MKVGTPFYKRTFASSCSDFFLIPIGQTYLQERLRNVVISLNNHGPNKKVETLRNEKKMDTGGQSKILELLV